MATATFLVFFVTEEGRANGHGNVLRGIRCREKFVRTQNIKNGIRFLNLGEYSKKVPENRKFRHKREQILNSQKILCCLYPPLLNRMNFQLADILKISSPYH